MAHLIVSVLSLGLALAGCSLQTSVLPPGAGDGEVGDGEAGDAASDGPAPRDASGDSRADVGMDTSVVPPTDSGSDSASSDSSIPDSRVMDSSAPDTTVDSGCPDGDSDGTCDSVDLCPGHDDASDVDGDGTPDGCDACPIDGPAATPLPASVLDRGITISNVSLNGGGNVVTVDAGDSVSVALDYAIFDCVCTGCIDQIEIGLSGGTEFQYCAYSGNPPCSSGSDTGMDTDALTAPATPGVYYLRFGLGQNTSCSHRTWWQGVPPSSRSFGAICVR